MEELLFLMLVAGIMASWFWSIGWEYLHDPSVGLLLGSSMEIALAGGEMWVSYLAAFQNGFFWEAALDAVVRHFTG